MDFTRRHPLNTASSNTLIDRRYLLSEQLDDIDGSSLWQAQDQTLDRRVCLRLVPTDHPQRSAVMDAARQAASVEDPRLARILDVGDADLGSFIVTEWLGVESLEAELRRGPIPAAQARAIIGECGLALEVARHRGLHHLRLSPARIFRLPDGTLRLCEISIAAALAGIDAAGPPWTADSAAARDARDLVAVGYACLTGLWPLMANDAGPCSLPQAPQVSGRVTSPAHIVVATPGDLDTLCSQTLGGSGGPGTPAGVSAAVEPWAALGPRPATAPTAADPGRTMIATAVGPAPPATPAPFGGTPRATAPSVPRAQRADEWRDDVVPRRGASRHQIGSVIGFFALLIVIVAFLAYYGLRGLPGLSSPRQSSSPTLTDGVPSGAATTTRKPTAAPGTPIPVVAGRGFDPEGDGEENDGSAKRAFDGDSASKWTSKTYKSAEWGRLKDGVGLELSFGGPQTITQVSVEGLLPGTVVELRTSVGQTLDPQSLATGTASGGPLVLTPAAPISGGSIVLWCTTPGAAAGGFEFVVNEVNIS